MVEYQNPDGSFMARFDREGYEYHYPLTAWRLRKIRHYIADLEEGKELQGRVTDTCSNGFFVDVGAEDEGYVPTEKDGALHKKWSASFLLEHHGSFVASGLISARHNCGLQELWQQTATHQP